MDTVCACTSSRSRVQGGLRAAATVIMSGHERVTNGCSAGGRRVLRGADDHGLQAVAAVEAVVGVDAGGGTRGEGVSAVLRAVPLSDHDVGAAWAGAAGNYKGAGHAFGCAADR